MDESMDRPYTEDQVFEMELEAEGIAAELHRQYAYSKHWRGLPVGVLARLIYDALVELRTVMAEEEDEG